VSAADEAREDPGFRDDEPSSRQIQQRLNDQRQLLARLMRLDALTRGDINAALAQVSELATELLGVERASIWRFDKHRLSIECLNLYEARSRRHSNGTLISEDQAPRYFSALEKERCIAAGDALTDPRTSEFADWYLSPLGIGAMLDVPIWVGNRMVGVICHEHVGAARVWSGDEERFAYLMAHCVALALERAGETPG
jgi:GAF domain-containing protein